MSASTARDYRELAGALSPSAVSQYLASHDWQLESRRDAVREIWRLPGDRSDRARIMLPLATGYADFTDRFEDALIALSQVYGVGASQLADFIVSARADLFFVRLDQPMADGTIPFKQAEATIDALYKMLKAAATTAHDPNHSHRGRRSSIVNDFLDHDVRLGHTQRGSFVFTILARLGDPAKPAPAASAAQSTVPIDFSRAAMQTLAQALETTRDLTRALDESVIESAAQFGLSAGVVESLEDITAPQSLRSLDLSFRWATSEPAPAVGTRAIILDRDAINGLSHVRERLMRREEPPRRETLIGSVRSLTREDTAPDEPESATIVLVADVRGKTRAVNVTVTGQDHDWAILAYRSKLPFTVTGDLSREGRGWRLSDPVVDDGFLRHHSSGRS
ncbi:hypothetical protein [Actinokineospora spheciospongiae]|uniref:hypothetical protein n=1 Tax=Actinokineospora spheciospongiae TaxID=909613 RepID=UPI000D70F75A|nr:hypothetical protein [Actinokineospora spheciospongiae]PWW65617.1 hypothetical protein DFQ13_102372 [Actinokineospora spheciospongiae]